MLSVAFSLDGKTLASGDFNKSIILWDVSLESWQARACRIANRSLTREEWEQFLGDQLSQDLPPTAVKAYACCPPSALLAITASTPSAWMLWSRFGGEETE